MWKVDRDVMDIRRWHPLSDKQIGLEVLVNGNAISVKLTKKDVQELFQYLMQKS